MMNKNKFLAVGIMAVVMTVSIAITETAAESVDMNVKLQTSRGVTVNKGSETSSYSKIDQSLILSFYKPAMDKLVKTKTITQSQENTILKTLKLKSNSQKTLKQILDALVKSKTITLKQENAILKAFQLPAPKGIDIISSNGSMVKKSLKEYLDELVKAGIINNTQADIVRDIVRKEVSSGKTIKDVLDSLVEAGTLTQTQENAILKVYPVQPGGGK